MSQVMSKAGWNDSGGQPASIRSRFGMGPWHCPCELWLAESICVHILNILEWYFSVWEKGNLCYYHLVSEYSGCFGVTCFKPYYLLHDLVPLHPLSFSWFLQDLGQVSIWKGGVFAPLSKCEHLGGNTAAMHGSHTLRWWPHPTPQLCLLLNSWLQTASEWEADSVSCSPHTCELELWHGT